MRYKNIRRIALFSFLLFVTGTVPLIARPQPDFTLWGTAYVNGVPLTRKHSEYTISIEVNGRELARYTMGSVPAFGDYYVLKIPMDDDPALTSKGKTGDTARIFINGSEIDEPSFFLGNYGETVQQDIHVNLLVYKPEIDVTPQALDYGEVLVGSYSSLSIQITNTGNADLDIARIGLRENSSVDFLITYGPARTVLIPGDSITLEVSYYPLEEGEDRGTLEIGIYDTGEYGTEGSGTAWSGSGGSGTGGSGPEVTVSEESGSEGAGITGSGTDKSGTDESVVKIPLSGKGVF